MPFIKLSERELFARSNSLHGLFAPLRPKGSRVAIGFAKDSPGGTKVLVATDRRSDAPVCYRDESFRTSVDLIRCRYFELWKSEGSSNLILDRAYFTLVTAVPETHGFSELLGIHSDPADVSNLKQGPHLHVSCAKDPIPHCHFPLDLGALNSVLSDCSTLTDALARAINTVATDVLPRFKA